MMTEETPQKRKGKQEVDPLFLAEEIYQVLDEKKAGDIRLLDLQKVNPYFCYFLIATANSGIQLKTLSREIRKRFGQYLPAKIGAVSSDDLASGWVVLDFIDLVVHIFLEDQRSYYNLERLWGDAVEVSVSPRKREGGSDQESNSR